MEKLNNRGFMLTETLVVASFVIATLVFLYTQFRTINKSYETSFRYNNAEELYALRNVVDYLNGNGLKLIAPASLIAEEKYIDMTNCPTEFLTESEYCTALLSSLNIKKIMISSENLEELKKRMNQDELLTTEMKSFISTISYDAEGTAYRLIAEFKNGTMATLKFS